MSSVTIDDLKARAELSKLTGGSPVPVGNLKARGRPKLPRPEQLEPKPMAADPADYSERSHTFSDRDIENPLWTPRRPGYRRKYVLNRAKMEAKYLGGHLPPDRRWAKVKDTEGREIRIPSGQGKGADDTYAWLYLIEIKEEFAAKMDEEQRQRAYDNTRKISGLETKDSPAATQEVKNNKAMEYVPGGKQHPLNREREIL